MPVPALNQANPASYDPVTNLVRETQEFVVESKIGAGPDWRFSIHGSVAITLSQVLLYVKSAFHSGHITYKRSAISKLQGDSGT